MNRKYEFYDTFKKSCEFKNGVGECHKTRESKKCINDKCQIIQIPMNKKDILHNYYNQIQQGSGESVLCPFCNKNSVDIINHIKTHKTEPSQYTCDSCVMTGSGHSSNKFRCPLCHKYLYIKHMQKHFHQHL